MAPNTQSAAYSGISHGINLLVVETRLEARREAASDRPVNLSQDLADVQASSAILGFAARHLKNLKLKDIDTLAECLSKSNRVATIESKSLLATTF